MGTKQGMREWDSNFRSPVWPTIDRIGGPGPTASRGRGTGIARSETWFETRAEELQTLDHPASTLHGDPGGSQGIMIELEVAAHHSAASCDRYARIESE